MKKLIFVSVLFGCLGPSLVLTRSAYAILPFVPILLIPVIHVIGVLFAGLALPFSTIGALFAKTKKKSPLRYVGISLVVLFGIVVLVGILLKLTSPERGWF